MITQGRGRVGCASSIFNRTRSCSGLVFVALCACAHELPTDESTSGSLPVVGGTAAGQCVWPSTVQVDAAEFCTGTLIHPRIVATAAHCLESGGGTAQITFGDRKAGSFTVSATCRGGAVGESGVSSSRDWGYCVLPDDARVRAQPIMPPLVGCEADKFLKIGSKAWIVGYGATSGNAQDVGKKRQVEVVINRIDKPTRGVIDVGDAQQGACSGDSGGPLYVHLVDGTHDYGWRVAGATSGPGADNCWCNCSSIYVNIAMHVVEIEKNENIDVTPCTDSTGAWDPGISCSNMQRDPANATGNFPSCIVEQTTAPIESCGSNPTSSAGGSTAASGTTSKGGTASATTSSGGETHAGGAGGTHAQSGRTSQGGSFPASSSGGKGNADSNLLNGGASAIRSTDSRERGGATSYGTNGRVDRASTNAQGGNAEASRSSVVSGLGGEASRNRGGQSTTTSKATPPSGNSSTSTNGHESGVDVASADPSQAMGASADTGCSCTVVGGDTRSSTGVLVAAAIASALTSLRRRRV